MGGRRLGRRKLRANGDLIPRVRILLSKAIAVFTRIRDRAAVWFANIAADGAYPARPRCSGHRTSFGGAGFLGRHMPEALAQDVCAAIRRPARKDTESQRNLTGVNARNAQHIPIRFCSHKIACGVASVRNDRRHWVFATIIRSIARIELVTGRFMLARRARQLWRSMTSGRAANNGRPGSPNEIVASS